MARVGLQVGRLSGSWDGCRPGLGRGVARHVDGVATECDRSATHYCVTARRGETGAMRWRRWWRSRPGGRGRRGGGWGVGRWVGAAGGRRARGCMGKANGWYDGAWAGGDGWGGESAGSVRDDGWDFWGGQRRGAERGRAVDGVRHSRLPGAERAGPAGRAADDLPGVHRVGGGAAAVLGAVAPGLAAHHRGDAESGAPGGRACSSGPGWWAGSSRRTWTGCTRRRGPPP